MGPALVQWFIPLLIEIEHWFARMEGYQQGQLDTPSLQPQVDSTFPERQCATIF